jgi:3-aminobutyryl-CoA ammonia-lyase
VLEVSATIDRLGTRSRGVAFEAHVVCRADPDRGVAAAAVLDPTILAVVAHGTVVVPPAA